MFAPHLVHQRICASCRLRAAISVKRLSRSRRPQLLHMVSRPLSTSTRLRQQPHASSQEQAEITEQYGPEVAAKLARERYGAHLPDGELNAEEYRVYERLYGRPLEYRPQNEVLLENENDEEDGGMAFGAGTGVLKEGADGELEEVEFDANEVSAEDGEGVVETERRWIKNSADAQLVQDVEAGMLAGGTATAEEDMLNEEEETSYQRAHPFTPPNRFTTFPSTLPLPQHHLIAPIAAQLAHISNTHLKQAAHRIFGGLGLPWSTSTPAIAKPLQQRSIPIDAGQSSMSEMDGDVFMATLVPGMYASAMSVLVETRKRLGTAWAENLVQNAEAGELRILDAGGAGAGILAVRELLRAEWERMHEESSDLDSGMALAEADGKVGGAGASPPLGSATVLVGSDELRRRASLVLENTTFIPRLPNYLHTEDAKKKGKFDVIVAPHTLWGLKENYTRKAHLQNLWSMLKQDGGVLLLMEKGVATGFEIVASARQMLLDNHIASPGSASLDAQSDVSSGASPRGQAIETGMIIAPCTNHSECPMYEPQGMVKGRRDICHFSQRYVRPPFLQTILGAKDKNFEDVKFSYLSVMRGRDLRQEQDKHQDEDSTETAFVGYEQVAQPEQATSLSLPRAILPPLKRRGHVILDLCTPAGTLERWTVPRSFSKQAFRDARKSSWGDLWALGAKTRVPRVPKIKKRKSKDIEDVGEQVPSLKWEGDTYGDIVRDGGSGGSGGNGKRRTGRKVKGVRDKRDKKADGNGRRKRSEVD